MPTVAPQIVQTENAVVVETPIVQTDDGSHDRFTHIVKKKGLVEAMVEGDTVTSLCGKVWVPMGDPKRYPVCKTCKEIYSGIISEGV